MKVNEMVSAITGKKVDDDATAPKWFGSAMVDKGKAPRSEELGAMRDATRPKAQDWSAVTRAWARDPEPTIEERLAALEERG